MKQASQKNLPICLSEKLRIFVAELPNNENINSRLYYDFLRAMDKTETHRSHYFEGRYENIYIDAGYVSEINTVLDQVSHWGEALYNEQPGLKRGFWFNYMLPGEKTLAHTHDDDQESLSAVYYVRVPSDSGQLVLGSGVESLIVEPGEGLTVLFPPDLVHKVTINNSDEARLSIGINIGK